MEIHKFSLEVFENCSINYLANVKVIFECLPKLWLIDIAYGSWNSLSKGL
jgi:hypothetical protein